MPKFVIPRRSGAHRVAAPIYVEIAYNLAAIALYRALLAQCAAPPLPLADDQRTSLRNIVRNKFRRNRHVNSSRLLQLAFTTGYELLDTLDRASSPTSTSTTTTATTNHADPSTQEGATALLTDLLTSAPPHLTRSPAAQANKPGPRRLDPSPEACLPPAQSPLAVRPRPASELGGTGVRQVPRLISANLFPMLLLGKPQPRNLSRVITDKVKQRQRRLDLRQEANEEWAALGRMEDEWDRIVWEVCGVCDEGDAFAELERGGEEGYNGGGAGVSGSNSWAEESLWFAKMVTVQVGEQRAQMEKMVRKMQNIVDQEAKLKVREREERRKARSMKATDGKRETDFEDIIGTKDRKRDRPI